MRRGNCSKCDKIDVKVFKFKKSGNLVCKACFKAWQREHSKRIADSIAAKKKRISEDPDCSTYDLEL